MKKSKISVIDLFSGPGGLSLGFSKQGFEIVLANDISINPLTTLKTNHKNTTIKHINIENLSSNEIEKVLIEHGYNSLDGIVGGPPCQGFSSANRKSRFLDNPKNHLFKEYLRIVKDLKPKFIVLENVVGLLSMGDGAIKKSIKEELEKLGYCVEVETLTAADYGVPQLRRRIVFIGNTLGIKNMMPTKILTPKEYISVGDAISDLPNIDNQTGYTEIDYSNPAVSKYQKLMRKNSNKIYNHIITNSSDLILERYRHIPQGGNWKSIPANLMQNYKNVAYTHSGIYRRLPFDKPSVTINNFRKSMFIHPLENRGLSVREAARIQSFPDDYIFTGTINSQQQQVADAVPPLMAEAIAKKIKAKVFSSEKEVTTKFKFSPKSFISFSQKMT